MTTQSRHPHKRFDDTKGLFIEPFRLHENIGQHDLDRSCANIMGADTAKATGCIIGTGIADR